MKKLGGCPLYADWRARSASRNFCSISQILLSTALIGANISITSVIAGIRKTCVVPSALFIRLLCHLARTSGGSDGSSLGASTGLGKLQMRVDSFSSRVKLTLQLLL